MSRFYFEEGDSGSISSLDDEDNLPYPEALPRNDFLAPDFDAPAYLSTLSNRHQTLEDLRTDLRERSQLLSKELLDLVNTNYEQFLSLGSDLRGGEEKVEDVRVGLLGFKRGVEDVKSKVKERGHEVEILLEERSEIAKQISLGRKLIEIDSRLEHLGEKLLVGSLGRTSRTDAEEGWSDSSDEDEDDEANADGTHSRAAATSTSIKKLEQLVQDYRCVEHVTTTVGSSHPFIVAQASRLARLKNTLLLDLSTAVKQNHAAGEIGSQRLLMLMGMYRELDEGAEAIKVLKNFKV